jgi:spore maturation protein CgeB
LLKRRLLKSRWASLLWTAHRRSQLHDEYRRRREHYHRRAIDMGLTSDDRLTAQGIAERLRGRAVPSPKRLGEIHTFAFVPDKDWHPALLPDLRELGEVTQFDYCSLGYDARRFQRADREGLRRRQEMNERWYAAVAETHRRKPIDWLFVYASGLEVSASVVTRIGEELGIPTVNMCLDDKQSWTGPWMGDHPAGQVGIAAAFDITWTSARVACEWYLVEGGRPVYMPEGFDASVFYPRDVPRDIAASFIGINYGFRSEAIHRLRAHDIPVTTFGPGWERGPVWGDEQAEVLCRSSLNLGMGGIGYSDSLTNVKTRDFEVPGCGGGAYLTSFNPDLAQHFDVGTEIVCYRNGDELVELARHYLRNPEAAAAISARARVRSLREHRWLHRYQAVTRLLGLLAPMPDGPC